MLHAVHPICKTAIEFMRKKWGRCGCCRFNLYFIWVHHSNIENWTYQHVILEHKNSIKPVFWKRFGRRLGVDFMVQDVDR